METIGPGLWQENDKSGKGDTMFDLEYGKKH